MLRASPLLMMHVHSSVEANSDVEAPEYPGVLFHLFASWRLCEMKVVSRGPHLASHVDGQGTRAPGIAFAHDAFSIRSRSE